MSLASVWKIKEKNNINSTTLLYREDGYKIGDEFFYAFRNCKHGTII